MDDGVGTLALDGWSDRVCLVREADLVAPHSEKNIIIFHYYIRRYTVQSKRTGYHTVGWLNGRTSVSDRRTFTGLHRPAADG